MTRAKVHGCLWAPEGAVPAARMQSSRTSSGTGSGEKDRTERRLIGLRGEGRGPRAHLVLAQAAEVERNEGGIGHGDTGDVDNGVNLPGGAPLRGASRAAAPAPPRKG